MYRKCSTQSKIIPRDDNNTLKMILYIHINRLQLSVICVMREKDTCTMCMWEDEKH